MERNEGDVGEDADAYADGYITQEPSPLPSPSCLGNILPCRGSDPLWTIGKAEASRLCRVYEEEMGIMYPVLDLSELLHHVEVLYGERDGTQRPEEVASDDVHILRLVFACALTAEASGKSELAMRLFESVREVADNCVWGAPEINNIIFLTLVVSVHSVTFYSVDC